MFTGLEPHRRVISGHVEHVNGPEAEEAGVNKTSRWQERGFQETMTRKAAALLFFFFPPLLRFAPLFPPDRSANDQVYPPRHGNLTCHEQTLLQLG